MVLHTRACGATQGISCWPIQGKQGLLYPFHQSSPAHKDQGEGNPSWIMGVGVISMTPKSISDPPDHISTREQAISGDISPNLYHMTPGPYLRFSVSSVHSDYDMPCSTLVLVPLCRYLRAVCTALAFIPPVCSSGYCTFHLPSYSPPLLIRFHLHI